MKKIIILLFLIYIFNLFSVGSIEHDCLCGRSAVIRYVLQIKENVESKVNSIPHNTKKLLAEGVIKAENFYDVAKKSITNGVVYIKNLATKIIDWAHEIKDS